MIDPQQVESKVDARYQVFLILWFALLMSVTLFLVLVVVVGSHGTPNPTLSYALLAAGAAIVFASFVLKQQLMRKAIEKRDLAALQSSHIVALALCESAALFGVLDRFVTASQTSWFLFAIAVLGILLHFPRKDNLRAASFK
jgi:predicted MFS family arabinose efflux permease